MEALEKDGVITPSDSPWNAPLLVVPKKPDINGKVKYRVCVDFRKLNQVTVGDAFPLPNITDILDQLGKSKYYTTLDLAQGYHQVPMNPTDREKTAFSTDKTSKRSNLFLGYPDITDDSSKTTAKSQNP